MSDRVTQRNRYSEAQLFARRFTEERALALSYCSPLARLGGLGARTTALLRPPNAEQFHYGGCPAMPELYPVRHRSREYMISSIGLALVITSIACESQPAAKMRQAREEALDKQRWSVAEREREQRELRGEGTCISVDSLALVSTASNDKQLIGAIRNNCRQHAGFVSVEIDVYSAAHTKLLTRRIRVPGLAPYTSFAFAESIHDSGAHSVKLGRVIGRMNPDQP